MNNTSLNPQQMAFGFLSGFFLAGSRTLAITITVFSRWRMGDRYFTFGTFLSGLVALWLVDWMSHVLGIANMLTGGLSSMFMGAMGMNQQPASFFSAIMPLYIAASLFHLAYNKIMEWRGKVWWGYSTGICWPADLLRQIEFVQENKFLSWLTSDWTMYRFIEPAFFFLLGQVVGTVLRDQYTSTWLTGASVGLFLNNKRLVEEQKEKLRDMRDAKLESEFLADAMAGKDKKQLHGFSAVPISKEQHAFFFGGTATTSKPGSNGNPGPDIDGVVAEIMN